MNFKRIILTAVLPTIAIIGLSAQNSGDNAPQKGDFTVGVTLGYNSYANITAQPGNLTDYSATALSTNWSDKKLMVGFEAGYFVSNLWKLSIGGGVNFSKNPGYADVPGTVDMTQGDNYGEIPNYSAVASQSSSNYNVFVGADRYFNFGRVENLMWYTGLRVGFTYGLNQQKADDYTTFGKSVAETWNLRSAIVLGIDYYVLKGMYVGAQIDGFGYTYNMTTYRPQEGLPSLQADSHNFSIIGAPTLKLGFKF